MAYVCVEAARGGVDVGIDRGRRKRGVRDDEVDPHGGQPGGAGGVAARTGLG